MNIPHFTCKFKRRYAVDPLCRLFAIDIKANATKALAVALIFVAQAVANSQSVTPELIVQSGHTIGINSIAFSPNGKTVATGSLDNTIKLWDLATGVSLRTFSGHTDYINSAIFSVDGKTLISRSFDSKIKYWDVETGQIVKTVSWLQSSPGDLLLSPDGDILYTEGTDGVAMLDARTGSQITELIPNLSGGKVMSIAISPDGSLIAAGSNNNRITIWNTASRIELISIKPQEKHYNSIQSVAFSPDGRTLVAGNNESRVDFWDVRTGSLVSSFGSIQGSVESVEISPDGQMFIAAAGSSTLIVERTTGKIARSLKTDTFARYDTTGKEIFASIYPNQFRSFDAATGETLRTFPGGTEFLDRVAFSPDGKAVAFGTRDVSLMRISDGDLFRSIPGDPGSGVSALAFNPGGTLLASGGGNGKINIFDSVLGTQKLQIEAHQDTITSVAFSPDGRSIASGSWDNTTKLWNTSTGELITTYKDPRDRSTPMYSNLRVYSVSFSPSGQLLASASGSEVRIWDVKTGAKIAVIKPSQYSVDMVRFGPDESTVATLSGSISVWDIKSQKLVRELKPDSGSLLSFDMSADGNYAAAGVSDNSVLIWDLRSGELVHKLTAHSAAVYGIAFNSTGNFLASAGRDGVVNIWRVSDGSLAAKLISSDSSDWLVTTPDGFFDGTPNAWKQLIWRFNNNTFDYAPVETYFNDFFYPNLLHDVLAGRSPKLKPGQELSKIDRRQPKVEIARINGLTKDTIAQEAERRGSTFFRRSLVEIDVTDNAGKKNDPSNPATSGAQDLRLFRNGSLVSVWHGDLFRSDSGCKLMPPSAPGEPRKVRCTAPVSLPPGDNSFTAYAFNSSNIRSTDVPFSMKGRDSTERAGTFYILVIGVDKYADPSLDLKFAVADVSEISQAVAKQQQQLVDKKQNGYAATRLITLTDELATKENVLAVLNRFRNADEQSIPDGTMPALRTELEKVKRAEPEDAILIYYAGHGVAAGDRFYLLPHNFSQRTDEGLARDGISDLELSSLLETIDAGKMSMAIDACQSGQALGGANEGKAPMNSKGLAQLAYDKGMFILTAAQSQQAALEVSRFGHGLLTYALLQGLEKADRNPDGEITERKWLDYAVRTVPDLQLEEMRKRNVEIQKDPGKRGAELVFVNGGNKNLPPEKRGLQTPRVFYRSGLDAFPLVIAKP